MAVISTPDNIFINLAAKRMVCDRNFLCMTYVAALDSLSMHRKGIVRMPLDTYGKTIPLKAQPGFPSCWSENALLTV